VIEAALRLSSVLAEYKEFYGSNGSQTARQFPPRESCGRIQSRARSGVLSIDLVSCSL